MVRRRRCRRGVTDGEGMVNNYVSGRFDNTSELENQNSIEETRSNVVTEWFGYYIQSKCKQAFEPRLSMMLILLAYISNDVGDSGEPDGRGVEE